MFPYRAPSQQHRAPDTSVAGRNDRSRAAQIPTPADIRILPRDTSERTRRSGRVNTMLRNRRIRAKFRCDDSELRKQLS